MLYEYILLRKKGIKIILLCLTWYFVSSANGIIGKLVLNDFPYPMTVSIVQLVSISTYMIPVLRFYLGINFICPPNITVKYGLKMLFPLALGKFVSSLSSHVSILRVPVSYAHTVKATMPVFTVALSRIIFNEQQTNQVYLSVALVVFGVFIASMTELSFNLVGLLCALLSTFGFSLQNIFSKKCLKETGMHEFSLLFILASFSTSMFFPIWFYQELPQILDDNTFMQSTHVSRVLALLVIDGFCNFTQNVVAFSIIAEVSPLTYAIANCTKRIAVIGASLFFLKNPVTLMNLTGMLVAIFGVLAYNKAKYDQRKLKSVLPTYKSQNGVLDLSKKLAPISVPYINHDNDEFVRTKNLVYNI